MKKLLGLVAVALLLSFATVSVGWAGPAQNHDQQKQQVKERPQKSAKQPSGVKHHQGSPGKENGKAPPGHNRSQVKNNRPQGPAKIAHKPPGHDSDQVKNNKPQGPAKIAHKPPGRDSDQVKHNKPQGPAKIAHKPPGRDNDQVKHNKPQGPAKISPDRTGPSGNHDRQQVKRHEPPREHPRSVHRGSPAGRNHPRNHSWHRDWPDSGDWRHHFRDWSWFASHRVHNLGTRYADDRHDRALYFHFEPRDNDYYRHLESRYGHWHYRDRHHRHGHYGWCHYWFRGDNIIAFFLGDDGYSQTFVWRRDAVEGHALAIGILTPDLQIVYSSYDADMPPDLAAGYTREVLWATVDDE